MSLVVESGQISSSHHIACVLGFGAAAVYPLGVRLRAEQLYGEKEATAAYLRFRKAAEKSLMKTMGKVGLCTVESYSGGEFFEPNFLDTSDPVLKKYLPNMRSPVGGVRFSTVAQSVADWHERAINVKDEDDIPILGLFKERSEGAGHSYGAMAVRGFVDMTEEEIAFAPADGNQVQTQADAMAEGVPEQPDADQAEEQEASEEEEKAEPEPSEDSKEAWYDRTLGQSIVSPRRLHTQMPCKASASFSVCTGSIGSG